MINNVLIPIISGGLTALIITLLITNGLPSQTNTQTADSANSSNQIADYLKNKDYVSQEDLVINAVDKTSPAVVSIIISKDVPVLKQYFQDANDPFGNSLFGNQGFSFQIPMYQDSGETEKKQIGGGSGFIVSSDGYIVTNKHVAADDTAEYSVFTKDGTEYKAEIIDKDTINDLAILKIEGDNFPYLEFDDSNNIKVGQTAIAIGNPLLEFDNSVSVGVISGLSRDITAGTSFMGQTERLEDVIQTDTAINPGNSGGPLLNLQGKVIGVNVAIANGENISFSIPSNTIKEAVDSVIKNGRIIRPYLGIRYIPITDSIKEKNNLTVDYGDLVQRGQTAEELAVIPGSPADKAGIVENDIILEVDGEKLNDGKSLAKIVGSKNVGDTVTLKIMHKDKEEDVKVTLEEPPKTEVKTESEDQ